MNITFEQIKEIEDRCLAPTYQKMPVAIKSGRGCKVWDVNGKEYIDFMTGYGVAILGHGYPRIVNAIKEQLENIIIAHSSLYNESRALFLKKLASIAPRGLSSAYLSNSGAEAIEAALKVVLKATKRKKIIAMNGAYHGKTLGALSLTFAEKYRKAFDDIIYKGVEFVEYGSLEAVERGRKLEEYAAIFVEPIQGEGGIRLPPEEYLKGLREIADKNGILLVVDEVQSGLGRTGKMWAHENWNIVPDVMTIGKGIGGGIPMGVTVARPEIMNVFEVGEHTSTMGGNPLACAAGKAVLDALTEDNILQNVQNVGEYLIRLLNEEVGKSRIVREVRGKGLMIAVELRVKFLEILFKAIELGLLTLYSGKTILRMLPPLIISKEEASKATSILRESLNWYEKSKI
ncbi:MAG: aminotransferase class III-fold pyridoxal phosphate-dependent enzyme [Nitrososphaeria archaeon]